MAYALGLDYGTNSCRALVLDLESGEPIADAVFEYPTGEKGIVLDPSDPHLARQHPRDYVDGLRESVLAALAKAAQIDGFSAADIVGIGVDTTGSTPIPVDASAQPLAFNERFADEPAALAWLWRDHTGHAEAEEITALAAEMRPHYIAPCGGTYSSEWFWSKALRFARVAPDCFASMHSFVELCDFVPGVLAGVTDPAQLKRSVCAAGHKAMFDPAHGGLPDAEFLATLDPRLAELRERLYGEAFAADERAGSLCGEWAETLGLPAGIAIAVGAFDAHMGAAGAGARPGRLVKILGTSTCDITVSAPGAARPDVRGICGVVDGSVLSGVWGIEAGQSAVGDIFLWHARQHVPGDGDLDAKFAVLEAEAAKITPGGHGLLALDWHNGNRTVLVDPLLSGMLLGQTLSTTPAEVYRAYIEATAFGALKIIDRIEEQGVRVDEIVCCGGLAARNRLLMQIYADITGRPMLVSAVDQTCAMGAAMFGAAAAGFASIGALQERCVRLRDDVVTPDADAHATYRELYALYSELHDAFGERSGAMAHVMKKLVALRERVR